MHSTQLEGSRNARVSTYDYRVNTGGDNLVGGAAAILPRACAYGLYAVIVHAGESASSGHYFSYCRRSDAPGSDLSLPDCPHAPWFKFNDLSVAPVLWQAWTQDISRSVNETAYVLFYRRLSGSSAAVTLRRWQEEHSASVNRVLSACEAAGIDGAAAVIDRVSSPVAQTAADLSHFGLMDRMQDQQLSAGVCGISGANSPIVAAVPAWATRVVQDNVHVGISPLLDYFPSFYADLNDRIASPGEEDDDLLHPTSKAPQLFVSE